MVYIPLVLLQFAWCSPGVSLWDSMCIAMPWLEGLFVLGCLWVCLHLGAGLLLGLAQFEGDFKVDTQPMWMVSIPVVRLQFAWCSPGVSLWDSMCIAMP